MYRGDVGGLFSVVGFYADVFIVLVCTQVFMAYASLWFYVISLYSFGILLRMYRIAI